MRAGFVPMTTGVTLGIFTAGGNVTRVTFRVALRERLFEEALVEMGRLSPGRTGNR